MRTVVAPPTSWLKDAQHGAVCADQDRVALSEDGQWEATIRETEERLPFMVSLPALMRTPEFHDYVKTLPIGQVDRVTYRLQLYKDLRISDPDGFQKLWDNPKILVHRAQRPSLLSVLVEYTLSLALQLSLIALVFFRATPSAKWLFPAIFAPLTVLSWSRSFNSVFGLLLGLYVCTNKPVPLSPASLWRIVVANLLEVLFIVTTCGIGFVISILAMTITNERMSIGQAIGGVYPILEKAQPFQYSLQRRGRFAQP